MNLETRDTARLRLREALYRAENAFCVALSPLPGVLSREAREANTQEMREAEHALGAAKAAIDEALAQLRARRTESPQFYEDAP